MADTSRAVAGVTKATRPRHSGNDPIPAKWHPLSTRSTMCRTWSADTTVLGSVSTHAFRATRSLSRNGRAPQRPPHTATSLSITWCASYGPWFISCTAARATVGGTIPRVSRKIFSGSVSVIWRWSLAAQRKPADRVSYTHPGETLCPYTGDSVDCVIVSSCKAPIATSM